MSTTWMRWRAASAVGLAGLMGCSAAPPSGVEAGGKVDAFGDGDGAFLEALASHEQAFVDARGARTTEALAAALADLATGEAPAFLADALDQIRTAYGPRVRSMETAEGTTCGDELDAGGETSALCSSADVLARDYLYGDADYRGTTGKLCRIAATFGGMDAGVDVGAGTYDAMSRACRIEAELFLARTVARQTYGADPIEVFTPPAGVAFDLAAVSAKYEAIRPTFARGGDDLGDLEALLETAKAEARAFCTMARVAGAGGDGLDARALGTCQAAHTRFVQRVLAAPASLLPASLGGPGVPPGDVRPCDPSDAPERCDRVCGALFAEEDANYRECASRFTPEYDHEGCDQNCFEEYQEYLDEEGNETAEFTREWAGCVDRCLAE